MLSELSRCPICGIGYQKPDDDFYNHMHFTYHNRFIISCRVISRFSAKKEDKKAFSKLMPVDLLLKITDLKIQGDIPGSKYLYPHTPYIIHDLEYDGIPDNLIILHKNRVEYCDHNDNVAALDDLSVHGFINRVKTIDYTATGYYRYGLSQKGLEALAGCLNCDLLCQPLYSTNHDDME